jgi:hypothetical protein
MSTFSYPRTPRPLLLNSTAALFALLAALISSSARADVTTGAIPGNELVAFAPGNLAGVARTQLLEQAFAVAAAYQLPSGYANLDIQNTFHRGKGSTELEDYFAKSCKVKEKVTGFVACVRVTPDRASLRWYLPDRLTVTLSAPGEKLVRQMAAALPLGALAQLSAKR